jgi:DNA polymerase-1
MRAGSTALRTGLGADVSLDRKLAERKLKTRMVLQVHDELLFEVPAGEREEVEELVRGEMEGVIKLNVPLVADLGFGPKWRDL